MVPANIANTMRSGHRHRKVRPTAVSRDTMAIRTRCRSARWGSVVGLGAEDPPQTSDVAGAPVLLDFGRGP